MRLPRNSARTIAGLDVTIPDDFTGDRNAVVVAFERSHLIVCRSWRAALAEALAADPTIGFYAIAVAGEAPMWRRCLVNWALGSDLTDDYSREHTALIFEDKQRWIEQAGLPSIDNPVLCVVDREGKIHATADSFPKKETIPHILRALLG